MAVETVTGTLGDFGGGLPEVGTRIIFRPNGPAVGAAGILHSAPQIVGTFGAGGAWSVDLECTDALWRVTGGDVWFDVIAHGEGESRVRVNLVRFTPGARTAWHSHSLGQTLHCTDGVGVVVTREKVIVLRPGVTVHTPPGEEHWHGALPDHLMAHLAIWEDDDAAWKQHVTDEEYAQAPAEI